MQTPLLIIPGWDSRPAHWGIGIPTNHQYDYGLVNAYEYRSGSLPYVIAKMEGLNVSHDPARPNTGINDNGIYTFQVPGFYKNSVSWSDWNSQSTKLYSSLIQVLDRHFGTSKNWRTDPTAQIDIVCHSQGCLVTREMLAHVARTTSPDEPCNHIRKVLSINAPHFGSPLGDTPVPSDHADDIGALVQGLETKDQVLFSGELDKSFMDYVKLMGRGGQQGAHEGLEYMRALPKTDGVIVDYARKGLAATGGYLFGAVMGGDADINLEVKGGYLGPYKLKTTVQPELLGYDFDAPIVTEKEPPQTNEIGKNLLAIHKDAGHLGTNSAWITSLRDKGYPRRPDGLPVPFQVMWSSNVRGIMGQALSSLAGIVPNSCPQSEENPAVGCYAFNDFIWSQVKTMTQDQSNLEGDFTNRYFDPNFSQTLQKLHDKWMLTSDILADETSQKLFSRNDLRPEESAVFSEPRNYQIHRALMPNLPYSQVPHGPVKFDFSEMFGGVEIPLVLDHPGAAQEGMDLYCALDRSCNQLLASSHLPPLFPTGVARSINIPSPSSTATQTAAAGRILSTTSLSGTARALGVSGDLELALVSQDANLQAIRIPDASGAPAAIIAWTPESGPWLWQAQTNQFQYLGTPGQKGRLLIQRTGSAWSAGFSTISGTPTMKPLSVTNSGALSLDVVESETGVSTYLVGRATPTDPTSKHPANPGSILVFHSETSGDARNVSRPRISVFNGTKQTYSGLKLRYFFTADPSRNLVVRVASNPSFPVTVQYLGSGVNMATVDLAGQTLAPEAVLNTPGLELELRYNDWSKWLVFRDWSNNSNYGVPKLNDRIQILDANGSVLWGMAQPVPTVDAPVKTWGALVSTESRGSSNQRNPRIMVANPGEATVVGPRLRYFFRVPAGTTPVVSSYYVPRGKLWVTPYSGNVWTLDWSDSLGLLLPGAKQEVGDFSIGLTNGASFPETDTSLSYRTGLLGRNPHVLLFNRRGDTIWGHKPNLRPDTIVPPQDTAIHAGDVQVFAWDEGVREVIHPKPRMYIKNTGTHTIQNLVIRYFFAGDAAKRPGLESDWYLPNCSATMIPQSPQWEVRLTCHDMKLAPGGLYPNSSGMVFGLHWWDWSAWDRSPDWSGSLLGTNPALNSHIVVQDAAGNRIWGQTP